jgi:hypothetical protein
MRQVSTIEIAPSTTTAIKWIVGGVLGVAGFLGIRKYIKNKQAGAETAKLTTAIESTPVVTSNLTINEAQAVTIANKLYGAMAGSGTDENQILACFQGRTSDDVKLIYKTFGVKPYGVTGKPTFSFYATELDLTGWLRKELSGNSLKKAQEIFTNAGIPF